MDRVNALDRGADDYLTKPFMIEEPWPACGRSQRNAGSRPSIQVGPLEMRPAERRVLMAGEEIELTVREYALLELFAHRAGELVTREEVHNSLYRERGAATSNVVDVYVGYLRRKLEADGRARLLHTKRGQGFVLESRDEG